MKKNLRNYLIIGLVLVLVAGFVPLSSSSEIYTVQQDLGYYLHSLPVVDTDLISIDSTLTPPAVFTDPTNEEPFQSTETPLTNGIVEYNVNTKTETVTDRVDPDTVKIDSTLFQPSLGMTKEYSENMRELIQAWESYNDELGEDAIRPTWIFGEDNRTLVADPTIFPYSSVVSIHVDVGGSTYIGSGAIIDSFHVLTVAHIAYIHEEGGWVDTMELVPAREFTTRPYGTAYADRIRLPGEWIASADYRYDWAVITLDRSIGDLTGWMGIATFDEDDPIYYSMVETAGYPGDLNSGWYMYNTSDYGKGADYYIHEFALDTYGGQSGSAIWMENASGQYIITILAYEIVDGADWNFGTRINDDLYSQIATFLMTDSDPDPNAELRSLAVGTSAGAFEQFIKRSDVLGIGTEVQNIGGIVASNVKVGFYLSEDKEITTDDYLVGTQTASQVGIMDSESVEWYGTIPKDVPNGRYYMGYIIDPDDTIEEYNENDNAGSIGSVQIQVTSTAFQEFIWSPLGTGIMIGGGVLIVLIPTIAIVVSVKKRRKRQASYGGYDYNSGDYQDPYQ
jgi:V8-like Glu-specific endopeptidase